MCAVVWLSQNYQIHNKSINIHSLQLYTYPPRLQQNSKTYYPFKIMFFVYLYKMGMGWVQGPFHVSTKVYFLTLSLKL
jgi:hypothetical protein